MQSVSESQDRLFSPRQVLVSFGIGVAGGGLVLIIDAPELWPILTWVVTTTVGLGWVWRISWPQDHHGTERLAELERKSRVTDISLLLAAVVSIGAIVLALVQAGRGSNLVSVTAVILSVLASVLSWALVNTVFAFKYARLFYIDEHGGIDFKQEQPPTYSDFAYMAFTLGMSFATPEAEPQSTAIRKVALGHALLAYAFATLIITLSINLVTSVGQS
jgi:hypothetical protein